MALYLYGLVDNPKALDFGLIGVGTPPARVYVLLCHPSGALVSDTDPAVFRPDPQDVLAHERVLERAMEGFTVLPVRFGTVAADRDELCTVLGEAHDAIRRDFDALAGKVEAGVKVLWTKEAATTEVERLLGTLSRLRSASGADQAKQRQAALQVGQLIEQVVSRWKTEIEPVVRRELAPLCHDLHLGRTFGVHMLLNLSLLVDQARWPDIIAKADELDRRWHGRFTLKCVAPLPPYNFVTTRLTLPGV